MRFVFDTGRPCLDLVRTLKERRGRAIEMLTTPADLAAWFRYAELGPVPAPENVDAGAVRAARRLREAIYDVISAALQGRRPGADAVVCLNDCAAHEPPVISLDGRSLRRTLRAADSLSATLSLLARDAIELVASRAIYRVRECANPDCTVLFVDTSRPGTRRWCTMRKCGNLAKVRTYRGRHRPAIRRRG